ncbi:MAG: hypothetical protein HQK49_19780 [Oligoflexia bacterium]|nr:hypothetical protein [Oligoflexia bacterium]
MKILEDLRAVIGLFFFIIGAILISASIFGPSDVIPSINIKANLWTGLVIFVFGSVMLFFGLTSKK